METIQQFENCNSESNLDFHYSLTANLLYPRPAASEPAARL